MGRRRLGSELRLSKSISMTPGELELLRKIGQGSASRGLRKALALYSKIKNLVPEVEAVK